MILRDHYFLFFSEGLFGALEGNRCRKLVVILRIYEETRRKSSTLLPILRSSSCVLFCSFGFFISVPRSDR